MTYFEIQEKLILTDKMNENHSFLELEFPYNTSYELMNLAIINAAKSSETHINFDFVDCDLSKIKNNTLAEIERESRMIYPSYDPFTYALKETFVGKFLKVNNSGVKLDVSATYTTELRFKDGKVRYEIVVLDMTADNGGRNVFFKGSIWKGYPIYNNKDELRLEETKADLENYLNFQVKAVSEFLNGKKSEKDDW
jgi:hypothetical protein